MRVGFVLWLLPLVAWGFSSRYVERQRFDDTLSRSFANCQVITQSGQFYDFMSFHGKQLTGFSSLINRTAIIEFCFSVTAIHGKSRYNPVLKTFANGRGLRNSVGHNFGYFRKMTAGATAFTSHYDGGDTGAPCMNAPRVSQLRLSCTEKYAPCPSTPHTTSNCTAQEWDRDAACICSLEAPTPCVFIANLNIQCVRPQEVDNTERKLGFLLLFFAMFVLLFACIVCSARGSSATTQAQLPKINNITLLEGRLADSFSTWCGNGSKNKQASTGSLQGDTGYHLLESMDLEQVTEMALNQRQLEDENDHKD